MNSKLVKEVISQLKVMNIPKKGMLVIKSDEIDESMVVAIKKGLKENFDFQGAVVCLSSEDDIFFVDESEGSKVFKTLINKVKKLEEDLGNLKRTVGDEHDYNLETSRGSDN